MGHAASVVTHGVAQEAGADQNTMHGQVKSVDGRPWAAPARQVAQAGPASKRRTRRRLKRSSALTDGGPGRSRRQAASVFFAVLRAVVLRAVVLRAAVLRAGSGAGAVSPAGAAGVSAWADVLSDLDGALAVVLRALRAGLAADFAEAAPETVSEAAREATSDRDPAADRGAPAKGSGASPRRSRSVLAGGATNVHSATFTTGGGPETSADCGGGGTGRVNAGGATSSRLLAGACRLDDAWRPDDSGGSAEVFPSDGPRPSTGSRG